MANASIKAAFERMWQHITTALALKADKTEIVQSDWSQTDETATDYIKNRPFYEATEYTTCVEEQTITFNNYGYSYASLTKNDDVIPKDQQGYKIIFDSVEYEGTVWTDSDECYRLDFTTKDGVYFTVTDASSITTSTILDGEHTIAIYLYTPTIIQLDEKFIPDSIARATQLDYKMNKNGPEGTGSFSMNRKRNSTVGQYSTAIGNNTEASGYCSHAEGSDTTASGNYSHAEGNKTQATTSTSATISTTSASIAGYAAHAEGYGTVASGAVSHAEGNGTLASGNYSHAEGASTTASSTATHAEGAGTIASGATSHAEGMSTTASGATSHAEGMGTTASGATSHAEGAGTIASGVTSHAEGSATTASGANQHVQGKYNIADLEQAKAKYAHIVGNGTSNTARSNAHTLDWNGNAWYQGDVYIGSTSGTNMDEGSKKLATEEYADSAVAQKSQVQIITWGVDD